MRRERVWMQRCHREPCYGGVVALYFCSTDELGIQLSVSFPLCSVLVVLACGSEIESSVKAFFPVQEFQNMLMSNSPQDPLQLHPACWILSI